MLESLKKKVTEFAIKADEKGLCKHGGGNFSIKDSETGLVVITPHAVSREELTYRDILVVDMEGNVVEGIEGLTPSVETKFHICIYKARPDIQSIVHTHSHYATAFAVAGKEIKPVVFESLMYGINCPIVPLGMPGTWELGEQIMEPISKNDALLLANHGVVAVGQDIYQAFLKALYVEDVAEIYYKALMIKKDDKIAPIPDEIFQKIING